ncbi:MAG: hypothetical protein JO313_06555 [Verrucomicrobia bacterium]|nr:hypothetical protein [Verrucomicrobiota bacterium]MBV9643895.1 hypothetical protein [Verrucomicrobiota bacterium]
MRNPTTPLAADIKEGDNDPVYAPLIRFECGACPAGGYQPREAWTSQTLLLQIDVPNPDGRLFAGQ